MKATLKNLLVLTRLEERMREGPECDRYGGRPALTAYDLWPDEHYHADRLVRLGFLRKARTNAPWYGPSPVTVYYLEEECQPNPFPYRGMQNRRMQERLAAGEALDLSGCPRSAHGEYLLGVVQPEELAEAQTEHEVALLAERHTPFAVEKDLCDAREERWMWSVGVHRETGRVWASTGAGKYRNPAFVCIWLR